MGQLGNGTPDFAWRTEPEEVAGLSDVVAIATRGYGDFAGTAHSVAVKRDGTVWEWPVWESYGQLKSLTPAQVAELSDVIAVAEGGAHSLALKSDGTVWAWGQNLHGQLGARTFAIRTTPVQVGLAAE